MAHERDDPGDRDRFARLAAGDLDALAELYDRHAPGLFRHALALVRQQDDAEDLVQATFEKLVGVGAALLAVRQPSGYLHRMLRAAWIDGYRRAVTHARVIESVPTGAASYAMSETSIDMRRALDGLPVEQREAVVLHVVEGYSYREIGRQTGVSLFTAAARYRLAMGKLRAALSARPPGDAR